MTLLFSLDSSPGDDAFMLSFSVTRGNVNFSNSTAPWLGMIARLGPDSILQQHGRHVLLNANQNSSSSSWFITIRSISQQYGLPDPLLVMQSPPTHYHWKSLTKAKVLDWWQVKLRGEAAHLDSLEY